MNIINVGIADLNVAESPDVLATYALGSCVGICLYDEKTCIAGLAHIMLPWSSEASSPEENRWRYADTGISDLIGKMCRKGASADRLTAKIAGGAQMFRVRADIFNIGEKNVAAVKKILAERKIPIIAEETGGNFGRTVFFSSQTGIMEVRANSRRTISV